jgi:hypothetical protein
MTGDAILIRKDGTLGTFFHEYLGGWDDEEVFQELDCTFMQLIAQYVRYVRLPKNSPSRAKSMFYY